MRDNAIDISKGIAILLMILAHTGFILPWDSMGSKLIFAFHMPLFFFFSGYFIKDQRFDYKKEARHLLIPYIVFSLIRIVLVNLKSIVIGGG